MSETLIKKFTKKEIKSKKIAIKVENLSKTFRIPHEKHTSLKSTAFNAFKKRTYEEFQALDNVNFEIKKGEFFGIMGRNGSGKSTLLKIIAGIYMPNKGTVIVNGKLSPFLELGVGFNFDLTARENVFLGGAILGLSKKEVTEKVDKIIKFAELEDFADMKLKNFSSGMQVRLAFSLAINVHAEILLMDEVLAVGDSNFQAKCLDKFNEYREEGKTVVLVSHDITTIQKYCDRAILVKKGEIVKIGRATDVGNEYIKQNMADEEARDAANEVAGEDVKAVKRERKVKIIKTELHDHRQQKKKTFKTGDDIAIRVKFKKNEKTIKDINIGIGIYKDDGSYILGYNTMMDNFKITRNNVDLIMKKIPLLTGAYYVNVVCFGKVEARPFDFKVRVISFRIFPKESIEKARGILYIPHIWEERKKIDI